MQTSPPDRVLTGNAKGGEEAGGHEGPVASAEPLAVRAEGQVAVGTVGVMVGRRETGAGSMESTAGDQRGRRAGSGAGEHLEGRGSISHSSPAAGVGIELGSL